MYNIFAVVILTLESPSLSPIGQKRHGGEDQKELKGIVTNPILLGIAAGFVWESAPAAHADHGEQDPVQPRRADQPWRCWPSVQGLQGSRAALAYLKPTPPWPP